jgi:hypothetical protein
MAIIESTRDVFCLLDFATSPESGGNHTLCCELYAILFFVQLSGSWASDVYYAMLYSLG